ncbi:MAG: CaiB/BaiF CoA-transferase family protein [Angelakisella sp.]
MSEARKPLAGVRVIELANFIAAATAGRFMADLGADVIKIEAEKGDPLRFTAPSEGRPLDMYENTTWELENANKRCISLNTKDPAGKEALFKLLENADVLITNWRVQALERAGLDYESIKGRFPKLVYAICTGYGENGPDKDLPGFDFTAFFARGGYLETLRQADSRPMNVAPGLGDHNVGMNLAAGILAALYQAKVTGKGEKVETSLFETAVYNMGMMVQAAQYVGVGRKYPINIREADNPCNAAFPTSDGRYIQICFPNFNVYYNKLMEVIERPDLINYDKYFPIANLQKNGLGTELHDLICAEFSKKDAEYWKQKLIEADLPFSKAQSWEEILVDPQAWANDCFYTMEFPNGNKRTLVRPPVRFREMGTPAYNRAPMIGEHGEEILKEVGYTDEEIAKFRADGALYIWEDKQ